MSIRVVLVDDDPDFRLVLRLQLDLEQDIEVLGAAADGFEGLRMFAEFQPDAAVIDLMMPGMDGFELARRGRESNPDIRMICYTAVPSTAARDVLTQLDVSLLRKSGTSTAIVSALRGGDPPPGSYPDADRWGIR